MNLFTQLFGRSKVKSKDVAKDRLLAVLVRDRINLSSKEMEQVKADIIEVISRYIEVDKDGADIALIKAWRQNLLIAHIPIISAIQN